ncbi:hypothetical protein GCM10022222_86380 [Amycolatopsis ultiminotia]|uniref:Carrier domain-containing protein n=2 Tax=Amycolatopsis ultiminotia TaxID=543629 RepID=A0ABP6YR10_9PSEU
MAELFVRGVPVDWSGVLPPSRRVDLPTYAFDHQHYWLQPTESATDAASLGQVAADHPMLGAVVRLPQSDSLAFTSRLSLAAQPWLAEHAVDGVVVLPGSGLVELVVRAGDEAGCAVLDELVIEAPLVVPERGGVRVQVAVGAPGTNGSRTVDVYSQPDGDTQVWTRHGSGVLSATPSAGAEFDFTAWPPSGAQPVGAGEIYEDLALQGFDYGPVFQGVQTAWRRGSGDNAEIFAEVALPDEQRAEAGRFGIHPALLDAALHPALPAEDGAQLRQPLEWRGLVLHAAGASVLRVRLAANGPDTVSLIAADGTGHLVASADAVALRALSAGQLNTARETRDSLFQVDWTELPPVQAETPPSWSAVATADELATLADGATAVLEVDGGEDSPLVVTSRVLEVLQAWLAGPGPEDSRLVVATSGAVPAGGVTVTDPAAAAGWGLVRSAQAENPGRIVLVDLDPASGHGIESVLGSVLACAEPQVAVRGTSFHVPRLVRAGDKNRAESTVFDPEGTVLVSGAGVLGGVMARHLVTRHGVRHLVLASRRGPAAEGAEDLVADLTGQGAEVSVVACDLSERDEVAALLAEHHCTGVVHTAGVLDDGVIGALTPERLAGVFAPKVDAVRHLDELTRERDLDAFIVFSSGSGVFGSPGQGNYAAANAFLDAKMAERRAAGLPGLSLAWGLWEQATGMTTHLGGADQARMSRGGVQAMTAEEGMSLFDAATGHEEALLVPVKLDLRAARSGTAVPHLLRGLVRAGRQQAQDVSEVDNNLLHRLSGLATAEQEALLVDLVRGQVATVLGHSGPDGVRADTAFKDAGFDSLTSVELRNRLRSATGLQLPATLAFDYPTPLVLARHLRDELGISGDSLSFVHEKLEDVESLISRLTLDESMKTSITLRLQGLVARCNGVLEQAEVSTAAEQLESASAEEVLDFIDEELGIA